MVCEALIPSFSLQDVKSFSVQQSIGEDICLIHLYSLFKVWHISLCCWAQGRSEGRWGRGTRILTWWCRRPTWPPKRWTEYLQNICLLTKIWLGTCETQFQCATPNFLIWRCQLSNSFFLCMEPTKPSIWTGVFFSISSIHHPPASNFLSFDLRSPLAVHEPVDLGDSLASTPKKHWMGAWRL